MPNRIWRALGAVTAMALSVGVGSAAAAENPTVTIDQRTLPFAMEQVVSQVQDACRSSGADEVTVEVLQPSYQIADDVVCSAALADPDMYVVKPLLGKASRHRNAKERADKVIELQQSLPSTEGVTYDRDEMIWSFARGEGFGCQRAQSQGRIRLDMASAFRANGETPEHWTIVEAVRDAGECPDKLPDLYRNVAALGNPTAANTVKQLLERKSVTLPLASIPKGVSARTVEQRNVFLSRNGNTVKTFRTDPHGTPGLHELWWCPNEKLFIEPAHAEAFDPNGTIIGGPASRGLDRFATTVRDGTVTVDLRHVVPGSDVRHDVTPAPGNTGPNAWNSGPNSFCFEPIVGG